MYGRKINKKAVSKLVAAGAKLYDVRNPIEFRNGSLPGAVNLPLRTVHTLRSMPPSTTVICYGDGGTGDLEAVLRYLFSFGFSNVCYLTTEDEE